MKRSEKLLGSGLDALFEETTVPKNPGTSWAALSMSVLLAFLLGAAADRLFRNVALGPPVVHATPGEAAEALPPSPGVPPPSPSRSPDPGNGFFQGTPPASGAFAPQGAGSPGTPLTSVPPDPALFHKEAVQQAIHKNFPLSPGDIDLIKRSLSETQKAVHGAPPTGRAVSVQVSLDPGAEFPEIHLVPGIATTISVVDATGAPWPLEDVIVGNVKSFPVRRMSATNGVVVEPQNNVGWTSLSLVLRGKDTPAVLKLVDSDTLSDTRVTARIEGRGPNAPTPVFQEPKPVVSARILAFLDGIPPSEARPMRVMGTKDMEAWIDGNRLFVRTHLDVLAPAWIETVSGPNGMKLYVFSPVSVITAAGEDGEMITVELGEGGSGAGKG